MTSYPEVQKLFNLKALRLAAFDSGALIKEGESMWLPVYHPFRHPVKWCLSLSKNPKQLPAFGKLLCHYSKYRRYGAKWPYSTETTEDFLKKCGLDPILIERFFRPFFGGIFLDRELTTQAAFFIKRFGYFLLGRAALPAEGMEAIPRQLAGLLKKTAVHLGAEAVHIDENGIVLNSGGKIAPNATVCALDSPSAQKLFPKIPCHKSYSTKCLYYSIPKTEIRPFKLIMLGDGTGPINTLSLISAVQPAYSPEDFHLLSASIVDPAWMSKDSLEEDVKEEISHWLKIPKTHFIHLKTYDIPGALPMQDHPPPLSDYHHPRLANVYLAGELVDGASINGALASGRKIAERIIRDLNL
jgi:hypothetical protein